VKQFKHDCWRGGHVGRYRSSQRDRLGGAAIAKQATVGVACTGVVHDGMSAISQPANTSRMHIARRLKSPGTFWCACRQIHEELSSALHTWNNASG